MGKLPIVYLLYFIFCLQVSLFSCDHHFLFNLKEKNQNGSSKVSKCCGMLADVTFVLHNGKTLNRFFSE